MYYWLLCRNQHVQDWLFALNFAQFQVEHIKYLFHSTIHLNRDYSGTFFRHWKTAQIVPLSVSVWKYLFSFPIVLTRFMCCIKCRISLISFRGSKSRLNEGHCKSVFILVSWKKCTLIRYLLSVQLSGKNAFEKKTHHRMCCKMQLLFRIKTHYYSCVLFIFSHPLISAHSTS